MLTYKEMVGVSVAVTCLGMVVGVLMAMLTWAMAEQASAGYGDAAFSIFMLFGVLEVYLVKRALRQMGAQRASGNFADPFLDSAPIEWEQDAYYYSGYGFAATYFISLLVTFIALRVTAFP